MSRVLVTGGSGFLGSHLVDSLKAAGHAVTVFDRSSSAWLPDGVTMIEGDLLDPSSLAKAVAGQDVVYHLAGFADLNAARTRPADTVKANILGTVHLLEAMAEAKVSRFLFASTVYVYSREGGFYRCSKQACESYIEEFASTSPLRYTILRFGSLYGPRADATNGVYRLLKQAMDGTVTYSGKPEDIREYIHVEDAANMAVEAMSTEREGSRLLLTGATATRAADLFTMFEEILGRPVDVAYQQSSGRSGHYSVTPYAYTPKPGRKVIPTDYVDMGQGLLQCVEELNGRSGHE